MRSHAHISTPEYTRSEWSGMFPQWMIYSHLEERRGFPAWLHSWGPARAILIGEEGQIGKNIMAVNVLYNNRGRESPIVVADPSFINSFQHTGVRNLPRSPHLKSLNSIFRRGKMQASEVGHAKEGQTGPRAKRTSHRQSLSVIFSNHQSVRYRLYHATAHVDYEYIEMPLEIYLYRE